MTSEILLPHVGSLHQLSQQQIVRLWRCQLVLLLKLLQLVGDGSDLHGTAGTGMAHSVLADYLQLIHVDRGRWYSRLQQGRDRIQTDPDSVSGSRDTGHWCARGCLTHRADCGSRRNSSCLL